MEDRRIADYFVVAGLPVQESDRVEEDQIGTHLKQSCDRSPITDLSVIFPTLGELCPTGFTVLDYTPTGLIADLNHGSLRSPEVFLCYRRGNDKPPLVDIGIMYEGKERILEDAEILLSTPGGRPANVNNSTAKTYVTYRRAQPTMPCNALVVTDICVIITSKGETPPHTFCIINKNLNKGMVGSDVFLCYKKSVNQAPSVTYKPAILSRYPLNERDHFPLPQSVPLFCLPMGATLEVWPTSAKQPSPVFSTFVLTVSDAAEKVYGSAVTFYEQYSKDKINEKLRITLRNPKFDNTDEEGGTQNNGNNNRVSYYIVKSICLLSHWPFFDAFEKFLLFLYNMSKNGPHAIPIERYILHFMENVPFPSPQRPRILVQLSSMDRLILMQPEDLPLPRSGAGFHQMLMNLGPDNCLLLLLCALTEQKLLIHSLRPDVLTAVAEAVSMIIFPFKWQCPYIPLCPLNLAEVLHAPVPFLIGVDSRFFDLYDPPSDVNCVDLDTNNITLCEEKRYLTYKLLPKKPARTLRYNLELLYHEFIKAMEKMSKYNKDMNIDRDFQLKRKEQSLELEIQEAFLKFMVSILKGYRSFLLPIVKAPTVGATDTNSLFNLQMFLRSRDKSHHKFYSLLTKTQMFIRFIEERSFVSDLDAGLAFFDECIEKVEQEDTETHLIELDESHQSERTVFISPPEQNGLPHTIASAPNYTYQNGFTLNSVLFAHKGLVKNFLDSNYVTAVPGSPMARRSKYEVKSAQKLARKYFCSPELWAKCLLGTCYSLWFIHLPSFVLFTDNKVSSTLRLAYELLVRIQKTGLQPTDEVCYRVMMQLCGVYNHPMLAVKLLILMKRSGVQPNAVTYGFYNRAVLESKWPSDMTNPSQLLWNKLRNVIHATVLFRQIGRQAEKRASPSADHSSIDGISHTLAELPTYEHMKHITVTFTNGSQSDFGYKSSSEGLNDNQENEDSEIKTTITTDLTEEQLCNSINDSVSLTDTDAILELYGTKGRRSSAITLRDIATFDKFCTRMGSIVKPCGVQLRNPPITINQQPFESSAGLLMTGGSNIMGFTDGESKTFQNEIPNLSINTSPRLRSHCRRNRSGSCSEFTSSCSPRNTRRHYSYYSPQLNGSKCAAHDSTDCYHLLTRSESFANDAQILQNLQEIKQKVSNDSKQPGIRQTGSNYPFVINNKSMFNRKGSINLEKLKEYPKFESRTSSSIETLPSSGTGSMDDMLSACSNATKRMNNKVMTALSSKFNKINDSHMRKFSVSSLEDGKKQSSESLSRVSSSPSLKSPVRTPVTENDPLGALLNENRDKTENTKKLPNLGVVSFNSEFELDQTGAPILFDRRKKTSGFVKKSNCHYSNNNSIDRDVTTDDDLDEDDELQENDVKKQKQRSSTMPADAREAASQGSPFKTGLGNLGSNFKLPFGRYSPSRFSLRKSDIRIGTQLIGNAINNFSPGSLTGRKSNEIIMGGLSSLKNAATSVAKKIDEFKEAMSANTTPSKEGLNDNHYKDDDPNEYLTVNTIANGEETPVRRKISSEFSPSSVTQQLDSWGANFMELFGDGSRKGSSSNLQPLGENSPSSSQQSLALLSERLYPKMIRDSRVPIALELIMTTCSKCHHCGSLIYDEEIMSGWLPEDSNLNTKCPFCEKATVPFLYVNILDYRNNNEMSQYNSQESMSSIDKIRRKSSTNRLCISTNSIGGSHLSVDTVMDDDLKLKNVVTLEPIIVPYLNPLVLRKELESILNTEGDVSLTRSSFVDEHPIVYWNMVWVFERIAVTSHVPGLCLNSSCVLGNRDIASFHSSWSDCDHTNVLIRILWDNPQLHEEVGYPMFVLWSKNDKQSDLLSALLTDNTRIPRSLMERVISCIQCNDLEEPIKRVAAERSKLKSHGINHNYSLYRDILFLSFIALGRENIDQHAFDKEYVYALENLSPAEKDSKIFLRCDNPNLNTLIYFRHYFKELDI